MKKTWHSYKLVILLVLAFLVVIPIVALGVYTAGYSVNNGTTVAIPDIGVIGATPACVKNTSALSYFIPTKTLNEWNAFLNHLPTNVVTQWMCGPSGNTYCVNGSCSGGKTHANCAADCACDIATDCGATGSFTTPWTCSGNNNSGTRSTWACNSNSCSGPSGVSTLYKTCGGGYNAKCVAGSQGCVNQCTPGLQMSDVDCGGCPGYGAGYNERCIAAAPYCDPATQCFTNGNDCHVSCGCASALTIAGVCRSTTVGCHCPGEAGTYGSYANTCLAGSYWNGSNTCFTDGDGYYSSAGAYSKTDCEAGYYCPKGNKMKCPSGTTSQGNASSVSQCTGSGSGS